MGVEIIDDGELAPGLVRQCVPVLHISRAASGVACTHESAIVERAADTIDKACLVRELLAEDVGRARVGEEGAAAFNWKRSIKTQLRAAEGRQLPLKRLRKATVAACQAHGGAAAKEELRATFEKKLAKLAGVVETVGDSVRLVGEPK